jgi:hypothetical protein
MTKVDHRRMPEYALAVAKDVEVKLDALKQMEPYFRIEVVAIRSRLQFLLREYLRVVDENELLRRAAKLDGAKGATRKKATKAQGWRERIQADVDRLIRQGRLSNLAIGMKLRNEEIGADAVRKFAAERRRALLGKE